MKYGVWPGPKHVQWFYFYSRSGNVRNEKFQTSCFRKLFVAWKTTLLDWAELEFQSRFDNKNNCCSIQEPKLKIASLKSLENFKSRSKSSLCGLLARVQSHGRYTDFVILGCLSLLSLEPKVCARFREHTTRWRSSLVQTLEKHFSRLSGML